VKQPADNPRTLLLIPSYAKRGIEEEVAANQHPQMDYYALQSELGADLADYAVLDAERHPLVRSACKLGKDVGLAMLGFLRRSRYDVIYSNGENVSIPLAAFFQWCGRDRCMSLSATIFHRKKSGLFCAFCTRRWMLSSFMQKLNMNMPNKRWESRLGSCIGYRFMRITDSFAPWMCRCGIGFVALD
jgi:hypothetical protein